MKQKSLQLKIRAFLLKVCILCALNSSSQSINCGTLVTDNSQTSYTVTSGNTLCIPGGVNYTGTIHLEGGTIQNAGTITVIYFGSGIFNNTATGVIRTSSTVAQPIDLTGKLVFNNHTGGTVYFRDSVIVASDNADSLIINVHKGSTINTSDCFLMSSGILRINLGLAATTTTAYAFSTAMNFNGDCIIYDNCLISILEDAVINVNGHFVFKDQGVKSLSVLGQLNVEGNIKIEGDGSSTSPVFVDNSGEIIAGGSLIVSMTDAEININNDALLSINNNLEVLVPTCAISNSAAMYVGVETIFNYGYLTTSRYFNTSLLTISNGVFVNNQKVVVDGDMIVSSADGVFSNNGLLLVTADIVNYGLISLGKSTDVHTTNFTNAAETASVIGPPDLYNESEEVDSANYSRVFITENSTNDGFMDGYIQVYDFTYENEESIRIDFYNVNTAYFGENIDYVWRWCGKVYFPSYISDQYSPITTERAFYCPGENVVISFLPLASLVGTPTWTFFGSHGSLTPSTSQLIINNIQSSGCVQIEGYYYDTRGSICYFNQSYCIVVSTASIIADSPHYFGFGNSVVLTNTVLTGGGPQQFTWTPAYFFVPPVPAGNHIQTPTVNPEVSLTYTVDMVDQFGCTASATVMVIGEPFALLDFEPNSHYYELFNSKLFFKHDGQYDNTGLVYRVYDEEYKRVSSETLNNIVNITTVKPGDNRYTLNATSLVAGKYTLEVINEKKERLYLRFVK